MRTELREREKPVRKRGANLQKGIETVGGKLYLTNQRLVFEPHAINCQRGTREIELSDIRSSEKCWTKFLGCIPIWTNSLAVITETGRAYRFVTFDREAWARAIDVQRSA